MSKFHIYFFSCSTYFLHLTYEHPSFNTVVFVIILLQIALWKLLCGVRASFFKLLLGKCCWFPILWTFLAIVFLKLNLDFLLWMGSGIGDGTDFWHLFFFFFLHKWVCYSWLDYVTAASFLCYCILVCGSANLFLGIQILSYAGLWVMLLRYSCFCHIISVFSH